MAGLAEQGVGQPNQERAVIDEVKKMLMQGVTPDQLLGQGVPEQIIMVAIQELEAEMAQQGQAQAPVTQGGQQMAPSGLAGQGY